MQASIPYEFQLMSQSVHFQPSLLLIDWEKHKYLSLRTHVGDPGRNPWLQPDPGLAITVARQSIENLSDTLSLRKNAVKHGMKLRPNFFFFLHVHIQLFLHHLLRRSFFSSNTFGALLQNYLTMDLFLDYVLTSGTSI